MAALGAAIYGAFVIHQKTVVNNSLNQVFNSGTNQAAVLNNLQTMGAKAVSAEVRALSQRQALETIDSEALNKTNIQNQ